jgi:acetylornithine deacetylase/succinyl-diaminopimelate desuccinylase-like protein
MSTLIDVDRARNRALAFVAEHDDAVIDLTKELVAAPSPNLPGDETAPAAVMQAWLAKLGLPPATVIAKEAHRPNLIVRIDGAKPGRHLGLCGHLDTKPVGEAAPLWRTDPFTPTIEGDRMYGLGTTDMKGACAAMVFAGVAFAQQAEELAGSLSLIFTADEEYGSLYGAHYLANEHTIEADAIILGEPSGVVADWDGLRIVSRGVSGFRVTFTGTQTHSSISDQLPTINAVEAMARTMVGFRRDFHPNCPDHPLNGKGPTINVGVRALGGYGYGVLPGNAEFWTDVRTTPGMTFEQFSRDVAETLKQLEPEMLGATYSVDYPPQVAWIAPSEVPADHPMVVACQRASEAVLGTAMPLASFPGATDAAAFDCVGGIPTLAAFGPGQLPYAHGPNEWVSLTSLRQAARMYALTAIDYGRASADTESN